jgi:hypothetical protein
LLARIATLRTANAKSRKYLFYLFTDDEIDWILMHPGGQNVDSKDAKPADQQSRAYFYFTLVNSTKI